MDHQLLGGGVKQQTLELQVSKMMAVMLQGVPGGRWDLQLGDWI